MEDSGMLADIETAAKMIENRNEGWASELEWLKEVAISCATQCAQYR